MKTFKFKLIGADGTRLEKEIESLSCQTPLGEISVLADHRPLITIVKKGELVIKSSVQAEVLAVPNDAILEVRPDEVRLVSTF